MYRCDRLDRFQLYYDSGVDEQIDSVSAFKLHVLVDNRQRFLSLKRDTTKL
jgi:hypothetical protein